MTKRVIRHGDFALVGTATQLADGRYGAQVVVRQDLGCRSVENRYPVDESFSTKDEAIDFALAFGKRIADDLLG